MGTRNRKRLTEMEQERRRQETKNGQRTAGGDVHTSLLLWRSTKTAVLERSRGKTVRSCGIAGMRFLIRLFGPAQCEQRSNVPQIDASGQPLRAYHYQAFGLPEEARGDRQPFRFTGREWDKEIKLYYYRARYYDPRAGRFLSEDPLAWPSGKQSAYAYVGNAPTIRLDPLGLEWIELFAKRGGGTSGGIPSSGMGWGHAWVDLYDSQGMRYGRGFYPRDPAGLKSIFGGNYGTEFEDDTGAGEKYSASYRWEISREQYESAKAFMEGCGKGWSLYNNCTNFAVGAAQAAGIDVENYTRFRVADPDQLANELARLTRTRPRVGIGGE